MEQRQRLKIFRQLSDQLYGSNSRLFYYNGTSSFVISVNDPAECEEFHNFHVRLCLIEGFMPVQSTEVAEGTQV